ncbi:MAG: hypothetical protein GVY33_17110 [Alphaproteobacteria bacterium]|jgi:hypothetical protein|nr:hypothetical protein [Alphaproteobacteria bacterium]
MSSGALVVAAAALVFGHTSLAAFAREDCPHATSGAFNAPMTFQLDDPDARPRMLLAVGSIEADTVESLRATLRAEGRVDEVWFHSPGGDAQAGLRLGQLIRDHGLLTRVPTGATCFSACSYAFLGGVLRAVDAGACYGVHMFTSITEFGVMHLVRSILSEGDTVDIATLERLEKELKDFEQRIARTARARADYLRRMSVSLRLMIPAFETESGDEYWLSREELADYNVANIE